MRVRQSCVNAENATRCSNLHTDVTPHQSDQGPRYPLAAMRRSSASVCAGCSHPVPCKDVTHRQTRPPAYLELQDAEHVGVLNTVKQILQQRRLAEVGNGAGPHL